MSEPQYKKLLTITIPTWNRAVLLKELLENITQQINKFNLEDKIEVRISDNCSDDTTGLIAQSYILKNKYIYYSKNETNIGLGPNVIKSITIANGKYTILLGDDDRLRPDCLPSLISYLEENPDTGILIDTAFSKKYTVKVPTVISLAQLLEKYFWYMGNAGVFVMLTSYIRQDFKRPLSFSWPQTQFMITGSFNHPEKKIHLVNMSLLGGTEHANITLYNSYYLWKVCYYEFATDIKSIEDLLNSEVSGAARKYLSDNALQNFFNILQCGVFIDDKETKLKTRNHILKNISIFPLKEKIYLLLIVFALWLPGSVSRVLSDTFIFLTRGFKGIEKKNNFVRSEKEKIQIIKNQKDTIIRDFSFEGSS